MNGKYLFIYKKNVLHFLIKNSGLINQIFFNPFLCFKICGTWPLVLQTIREVERKFTMYVCLHMHMCFFICVCVCPGERVTGHGWPDTALL